MSFLNDLRTKRHRLTPTKTTVTRLDGRKFQESLSESEIRELGTTQFGFVVDMQPDDIPAKIVDYLYLGSQDCSEPEVLKKFDIDNVLSLGVEASLKCDDVVYKFIKCLDFPEINLSPVIEESVRFIEDAVQRRSNVLVHCNAGVSRSASVVIGYLIIVRGYDYLQAYDFVKKARRCIRPNDGFVEQLKKLSSR